MSDARSASLSESASWPFVAAAALLTDFSAEELRPLGGGAPDVAKVGAMLLEHGQPIRIGPAKGRWSLSETSRRAAVSELHRLGKLREALEANRRPDNPTQRAVDALASGAVPSLDQLTLPDLLGLERAVDLLGAAVAVPGDMRARLTRRIERLRLLEPLQRLVAHGFAGREPELRVLRSYVDELGSQSIGEALFRGIENVLDVFRVRPPLVIWGPGGVGKSTLVAKFLLDHAGPEQPAPLPFVYLDFDRGQLDPMQPDSLVAEAFRQIQVQFPDFAREAAGLAADAETRIASEDVGDISRSAHFVESAKLRQRFAGLLREISEANGTNVLLLVDTFEVVQRRGSTPVFNVLTLAAELVEAAPALRLVIVGRAALRDSDFSSFTENVPRWKPLPLQGFDKAAGRLYLQARLEKLGNAQVKASALDRIVSLVRGNPLSLRLAAQVFTRGGVTALEDAVEQAEFDASFTQERLQGMLHARIVANLDEDVRTIADPGLVLRRLTPDVIEKVLAGPCHLDLSQPGAAQHLFDRLQSEVALVELVAPFTLRHRPDVRLLMLPLLRAKLLDTARAIDEAAVSHWASADEPDARAEEIYHLLWLGADRAQLDAAYARGPVTRALLEEALDEFDALGNALPGGGYVSARLWLCGRLEREISGELEYQASLEEWEQHAARRARNLLASGAAPEALAALRGRPDRSPTSALWLLEIDALKLLARDREALDVVELALKAAAGSYAPAHVVDLLLHKASLLERANRNRDALECVSKAAALSRPLGDDVLEFESKLAEARLARTLDLVETADLHRELTGMLDRPTVAQALERRPALLREASAEVGDLRPDLFIRAEQRRGRGGSDRRGEAASLVSVGVAYAQRNDLAAAEDALGRARALAVDLGETALEAQALLQLGGVFLDRGELERSMDALRRALALAESLGDADLELRAEGNLGNVHAATGRYDEALAHYRRSLEVARRIHNRSGEGNALSNLANIDLILGRPGDAIELLEQDLVITRELGDRLGERQTLSSLATAHWYRGERHRAIELYTRSLQAAVGFQDRRGESAILNNLGSLHAELGNWEQATSSLERALWISREIGDKVSEATAAGNLGLVHAKRGNYAEARVLYEQQFRIAESSGDVSGMGIARYNNALASGALGQREVARSTMTEAARLLHQVGSPLAGKAEEWLATGAAKESPSTIVQEMKQGRFEKVREMKHGRFEAVRQLVDSAREAATTYINQTLLP